MPMVQRGTIIVPSEEFVSDKEKYMALLDIVSRVAGKVLKLEEVGVAYLTIPWYGKVMQLALGINSMGFVNPDRELIHELEGAGVKYYIVNKPFWCNYCKLDLLNESILNRCLNLVKRLHGAMRISEDARVLELIRSDEEARRIIPMNTVHPVTYGILTHVEYTDKYYEMAFRKYIDLHEPPDYDILAYAIIDDGARPYIMVNDVRRIVRIECYRGVDDTTTLIILNSLIWITCR